MKSVDYKKQKFLKKNFLTSRGTLKVKFRVKIFISQKNFDEFSSSCGKYLKFKIKLNFLWSLLEF